MNLEENEKKDKRWGDGEVTHLIDDRERHWGSENGNWEDMSTSSDLIPNLAQSFNLEKGERVTVPLIFYRRSLSLTEDISRQIR